MPKLTLIANNGELLAQWTVTGQEISPDDGWNVRGSFARSALISEIAEEVMRHENSHNN